ncbi:nuclease A inhibitor family protein [Stenomitos frigidus]|nr:nuclease A inhibitor family protein [Stenomitos frigidus]
MNPQSADLLTQLQAATAGLLWLSEMDAPFQVKHWSYPADTPLTTEALLQLTKQPPNALVKALAVDDFFAGATEDQDWFGEEEKAIAARYRELVALLKQHLSDLTVYQVGEVTLDIYVVGRTPEGELVGLATQASET